MRGPGLRRDHGPGICFRCSCKVGGMLSGDGLSGEILNSAVFFAPALRWRTGFWPITLRQKRCRVSLETTTFIPAPSVVRFRGLNPSAVDNAARYFPLGCGGAVPLLKFQPRLVLASSRTSQRDEPAPVSVWRHNTMDTRISPFTSSNPVSSFQTACAFSVVICWMTDATISG